MKDLNRGNFFKLILSTLLLNQIFSLNGKDLKRIKIKKRMIPSGNEKIPIIGLGTWRTFDIDENDLKSISNLKEILDQFIQEGGNLIDSSPMYGNSEKIIGKLNSGNQQNLFLATKVWTSGKENGIAQIESSFKKMNTNFIHLFQIHNLVDWKTHLKTLRKYKEKGRIKYIGITHYTKSAFSEMEKIMKTEEIDFIQIPYSVVLRDAENKILPLAKDKGIATLINRPFEGGDLFSRYKNKKVPEFIKNFGCNSIAQVLLKYILSTGGVTCVIPATSKIKHLLDNMHAGKGRLPDEKERKEIIKYFT
ncbi:MAG: aldo/keto reductase [Leptospiraceae bacterium]|nr:aldo/keto reductase [Leptospiraceae bacterium]